MRVERFGIALGAKLAQQPVEPSTSVKRNVTATRGVGAHPYSIAVPRGSLQREALAQRVRKASTYECAEGTLRIDEPCPAAV